jgi:hypothetical protein
MKTNLNTYDHDKPLINNLLRMTRRFESFLPLFAFTDHQLNLILSYISHIEHADKPVIPIKFFINCEWDSPVDFTPQELNSLVSDNVILLSSLWLHLRMNSENPNNSIL